jgi:hypothetical protein
MTDHAAAPLTAAELARTLKLVQSLGWLTRREGRDNTADECDQVAAILNRAQAAGAAAATDADKLRALLRRYVGHVRSEEGVDFIDHGGYEGEWGDEDMAALRAVLDEPEAR